jgi:serine/threonine protein kinase
MISALQHPNLVKLYGCCIEGNQLLLMYEYMENNSLARALFGKSFTNIHHFLYISRVRTMAENSLSLSPILGREEHQLHLDWPTRKKICLG